MTGRRRLFLKKEKLPTSDHCFEVAKQKGLQLSILIEQENNVWQACFKENRTHLRLGYGTSPQEALKNSLEASLRDRDEMKQTKPQLPKSKSKRRRVRL